MEPHGLAPRALSTYLCPRTLIRFSLGQGCCSTPRGGTRCAEPWSSKPLRVTGLPTAALVAIGWSRWTNPLPLELDCGVPLMLCFLTVAPCGQCVSCCGAATSLGVTLVLVGMSSHPRSPLGRGITHPLRRVYGRCSATAAATAMWARRGKTAHGTRRDGDGLPCRAPRSVRPQTQPKPQAATRGATATRRSTTHPNAAGAVMVRADMSALNVPLRCGVSPDSSPLTQRAADGALLSEATRPPAAQGLADMKS